jgi:hypothetical protein
MVMVMVVVGRVKGGARMGRGRVFARPGLVACESRANININIKAITVHSYPEAYYTTTIYLQ